MQEAQFNPSRLWTLRTPGSAAYKGVYALLLKEGAEDWRAGQVSTVHHSFEEAVDNHHEFPRAWAEAAGIAPSDYHSIVNKTPLSARTNRIIGGNAPSEYLQRLTRDASGSDRLEARVCTHLIDVTHLRTDAFEAFLADRAQSPLARIGLAIGKVITGDPTAPVEVVEGEDKDL